MMSEASLYTLIMLFVYPVVGAMSFTVMYNYGRWAWLIIPARIQKMNRARWWSPAELLHSIGDGFIILAVLFASIAWAYDTTIALIKIVSLSWFRDFFFTYFEGGLQFVERLIWQAIKIAALLCFMGYRFQLLTADERRVECPQFWVTTLGLSVFYCVVMLEIVYGPFGSFFGLQPQIPHLK